MNGELSQLICLATYGTGWLRRTANGGEHPDLSTNTTFKYVHSTEFIHGGGQPDADPSAWLSGLRQRGHRRLWLGQPEVPPVRSRWPYLEPHLEVAFANGGHWFVLATGDGATEQWEASWSVVEPRPADNRIWAIRYESKAADDVMPQQPALGDARSALDAVLSDARAFANRAELADWAAQFTEAIETDDDGPPYQPDLIDPAFPDEARRLMAKAARSWVFGGMGSWNDVALQDESQRAEHTEISRWLFASVMQACVAAVNCPLPD